MDLDAYRQSAEAFVSKLTNEYYRHFAGLKASYEIEPIYEDHAELFTARAVDELRTQLDRSAGAGGEERRRLMMLLDFAVEGYIGQATKHAEAALARLEATITVAVDGDALGFRGSAVAQANEPDPARRAAIERARLEATDEQLNPLHREVIEHQHRSA